MAHRGEVEAAAAWEALLPRDRPVPLSQTWAWGEARRSVGFDVRRYRCETGGGPVGVQVELRPWRFGWAPGAPVGPTPGALGRVFDSLSEELQASIFVSPHESLGGNPAAMTGLYHPGTIVLDISAELAHLRSCFSSKWRNCLRKAERSEITITEGSIEELVKLSDQLAVTKGFRAPYGAAFLNALAQSKGEHLRIRAARHGNDLLATWADFAAGTTATYFMGASSLVGRRVNAAYALAWDAICRLRSDGVRFFDLGGVDPDSNTGVDHFKRGTGGEIVRFPGTYMFGPRVKLVLFRTALAARARLRRSS